MCIEERNKTIFDMWLACYTQEEIAEAVKMARPTVEDRIEVLTKMEDLPKSSKLSTLYQDDRSTKRIAESGKFSKIV